MATGWYLSVVRKIGSLSVMAVCQDAFRSRPSIKLSMSSPSAVRQIQGASRLWTNVWPAVVRPAGGLWQREDPRTLHTQHSARLLLLLQVGVKPHTPSKRSFTFTFVLSHDLQILTPQYRSKQRSSFIFLSPTIYQLQPPKLPLDIIKNTWSLSQQ